jgi:hypothetical protein
MGLLSKAVVKNSVSVVGLVPDSLKKPKDSPDMEAPVELDPEYAAAEGLPAELKNEIIKYCNTYTAVHGIVLAYPQNYDEKKEGESFNHQVNRIIAALGSSVPLPSRHSLALFSNTVDRELLAHRLSKSLGTEALAMFAADNVGSMVEYIRPYL